MKVKDVMMCNVVTARPETPARQVVDILLNNQFSGLPVVDSTNTLVGVLTEKDILKFILPGYLQQVGVFVYEEDPKIVKNKVVELMEKRTVGELMQKEVITIGPDASLSEAARIVLTMQCRRIPVVDANRKVIGIITRQDVLRAIMKLGN